MASISLRRCDNCGLTVEAADVTDAWVALGARSVKWPNYGYSNMKDATSGEFCSFGCGRAWLADKAEGELATYLAAAKKRKK